MKKKLPIVLLAVMAVLFLCKTTDLKAAGTDRTWNYKKTITKTLGAFTYHAYPSKNGKTAWIYKIDIDDKQNHSKLSIPASLDGKKVTCIGHPKAKDDDDYMNIFHSWAEPWHKCDSSTPVTNEIKKLTIPDTVTTIQPVTFSGLDSITTVTIPDKVTVIDETTFYGCDELKTVNLPAKLKKLAPDAFMDCPNLSKLNLPSKNKYFTVKNKCVIRKKDQALVYAMPTKKTLKIPGGTRIITSYSLNNCTSPTVNIPASVDTIERFAFNMTYTVEGENTYVEDVTVSKKNKTFAKDGQCIYNKVTKTLSIAMLDSKGCLYVSDKVEHLTDTYSLVTGSRKPAPTVTIYKKVVLPKTLKTVSSPAFFPLTDARNVYFMGETPPEVYDVEPHSAALPIFSNIYVPEQSNEIYTDWYEKYGCMVHVNNWEIFDPESEMDHYR